MAESRPGIPRSCDLAYAGSRIDTIYLELGLE
jgi:hypothetical protein